MENRESTERRHREASVVFADIAGFTAPSEQLGPEGIAELMEECFHELERIILAHGGTIDKYIGDCVMALFGAEEFQGSPGLSFPGAQMYVATWPYRRIGTLVSARTAAGSPT